MSIRNHIKDNILNDTYYKENCKDYITGMNMNLIISNYVATPRNPLFGGIKPPRDIRPPAISNSIDIVAVNNSQKLKGNKDKIAKEIMKVYEVKAQNFKTPKVTGVQDLYSKKLYNKNNDFDKYYNNYFHENSHNLDNVNVSAPRNYVITGMSQSQAMLSQAIGSQSQLLPPPITTIPPIPPRNPRHQPKKSDYMHKIRLVLDNIDIMPIKLNPTELSITQKALSILQHPASFTTKQAEEAYANVFALETQIQQALISPTSPSYQPRLLKKEILLNHYYQKIEDIKALGPYAQNKLNLFLARQQILTSHSSFKDIQIQSSNLHNFIIDNQYQTSGTQGPSSSNSPLPQTPLSVEIEQLKKQYFLKAINENLTDIKSLGIDAQSKLNLFLLDKPDVTLESDLNTIQSYYTELHNFIVNNNYANFELSPTILQAGTPIPQTP